MPLFTYGQVQQAELDWIARQDGVRDTEFGWCPYDIRVFLRLLAAAVYASRNGRFLDLGCGIGTKCVLAESVGLRAEGIERVPAYIAQAREWDVTVHEADLLEWTSYSGYGIVYVNHPLRGEEAEEEFERKLEGLLDPGTVLIKVNDCGPPPGDWETVIDERDLWRGVWVKGP